MRCWGSSPGNYTHTVDVGWSNPEYTITGLTPLATYNIALHFAEIYWTKAGQREFNVSINGTQVLTDVRNS